ncbi:MAG: metalloregulator ArsR/SmtB family transcription factor [Chloroflexi bacterium]|nr:metalloregulator ArsR/SmtB family transcription factor [Chloroflexota bacterium]
MDENINRTATIAQALAHPLRLRILELLREQGAYVMHLTATLQRPQANISQHLAILREAGLVQDEREGMTVVYRVVDPRIFDVIEQIQQLDLVRRESTEWAPQRAHHGRGMRCRCPRCRGDYAQAR